MSETIILTRRFFLLPLVAFGFAAFVALLVEDSIPLMKRSRIVGSKNTKTKTDPIVEWEAAPHNNPAFPSDIYCQKNAHSHLTRLPNEHMDIDKRIPCYRQCSGDPNEVRNVIVWVNPWHKNHAGLYDRRYIIDQLLELAGYLCATLYVDPPNFLLGSHDSGHGKLDPSLTWDDFYEWSWHTPESMHLPPPLQIWSGNQKELMKSTSANGTPLKWAQYGGGAWVGGPKFVQNFQEQIAISKRISEPYDNQTTTTVEDTPPNRFLWLMSENWYKVKGFIERYCEVTYHETKHTNTSLHLPLTEETSYVVQKYSPTVQPIVDRLWNATLHETLHTTAMNVNKNNDENSMIIGAWHIRRGDAKGKCNTELERMATFINCTFAGTEKYWKRMAVLVLSDEKEISYFLGLQELFARHAPHVQMVHVDDLITSHMQQWAAPPPPNTANASEPIPKRYLNNYHTFLLENELFKEKANAFFLEHRRFKSDCPDCVNLLEHLPGRYHNASLP